jgi:hypothetical protein
LATKIDAPPLRSMEMRVTISESGELIDGRATARNPRNQRGIPSVT